MNERAHRLFFAIWPQAEEAAALQAAAAEPVAASGGRAVPLGNLHLTLAFLGSVPAGRIAELTVLGERLSLPAFAFTLDRLGRFARAGVLWAGPSSAPAQLPAFAGALAAALDGLGFPAPQAETFNPHVTLARRVRRAPRVSSLPPVTWQARDFALVESETHPQGSRYRRLATWPSTDG